MEFASHREETKAVKQALADVAIHARVKHGTGTAYGWLKIYVDGYHPPIQHDRDKYGWNNCSGNCTACIDYRNLYSRIIDIACTVTGRSGDYDGRINVQI